MEGWEMEGRPELLPCVDDDVDVCSDERLGPLETAVSFYSETVQPCVGLVFVLLTQAGEPVESEKEQCVLEACHARKA